MDSLIILSINFNFRYGEDTIYPVLLQAKNEMVLVDCGYPNFLPLLEQSAYEKSIDFSKLTKAIITHHDHDHMGSIAAIKQKYPQVQVIACDGEALYVAGKAKSLRLEQAEQIQKRLPPDKQESGKVFQEILRAIENVQVDITVKDKDYFPWCGGVEIITTPGHTPGHISVYI